MVVVPPGRFTLGSPESEPGRNVDEGPHREIRIDRAFAAGRFEVTVRQYEWFLRESGHPVSGNCVTDRRKEGQWEPDAQTNVRDPGYRQGPDYPAACVNWNDAKAYVGWLNKQTGGGYRLLTEVEWEYLARAGSATAYPWGDDPSRGCSHMNGFDITILEEKGNLYRDEPVPVAQCRDGFVNAAPVGSFAPNGFGIYDLIGNLSEWVEDCATVSYVGHRGDRTFKGGDCTRRMVRGGSWGTMPRQLRTAERFRYRPTDVDDSIGIRVAKDLPAAPASLK